MDLRLAKLGSKEFFRRYADFGGGGAPVTINNITGDISQAISNVLLQTISNGTVNFFWGSGVDGAVTFAVNTTLAANANIKQYTTAVVNAGVTVKSDTTDYCLVIYASVSLTLGANAQLRTDMGGGGAGGNFAPSGGGVGGAGGNASGSIAIFAKSLILGSGAMIGGGWNGGNGAAAGASVSNASGGDGAAAGVVSPFFCSVVGSIGNNAQNGSGSYAETGYTGALGGAEGGVNDAVRDTLEDPLLWIQRTGKAGEASGFEMLRCVSRASPGGGQGKNNDGAAGGNAGGGAGAGAASWIGAGGQGGSQPANANSTTDPDSTGGGSGGGGAPGVFTLVICGTFSGSGIISAAGGNGGAGGNGNVNGISTSRNTGGSGGGGAPGGIVVVWGPANLSAAAITADGGGGGTGGTSFGGASPGAAVAGSNGYKHVQMG